ncbi:MAG: HAD family phosphatase [Treponema sp.]|nr:HAD family phosphatase [Treponema sp.]
MLFIFDMGGVVTTTFPLDVLTEKIGLTKTEFLAICRENGNIWAKLEKGEIDIRSFWESFNKAPKAASIPFVKNDLFHLYFHPQLQVRTAELITALRKKHRVVCGTNTIQSHWENHMERGDYAFFDQTYASNKIGEAKPDTHFFEVILEAEGYDAKDAFFTDDRMDNCEAAKSVGINAVQFKSPEQLWEVWGKYI